MRTTLYLLSFLLITGFLFFFKPNSALANQEEFRDLVKNFTPCSASGEDIDNKNFHSLRPFPGSPCYPDVEDFVQMCGNDLITSETFRLTAETVDPQRKPECTAADIDQGTGLYINDCCDQEEIDPGNPINLLRFTCHGNLTSRVKLAIDLRDAMFPIIGNVEDVSNLKTWHSIVGGTCVGDRDRCGLSLPSRLGNYVSWYLNGAIYRPEEHRVKIEDNPTSSTNQQPIPTNPDVPGFDTPQFIDYQSEGFDQIINYTGPINKLLSQQNQIVHKNEEIGDAVASINQSIKAAIRHDQIGACMVGVDFGGLEADLGIPVPCYNQDLFCIDIGIFSGCAGMPTRKITLEDWSSHKGPIEYDDPSQSTTQWTSDYKEWHGDTCFIIKPFFLPFKVLWCFNNPASKDFWGDLFPGLPYTSTEDRAGRVGPLVTNIQNQPVPAEGNEVIITSIEWTPLSPDVIRSDSVTQAQGDSDLPAPLPPDDLARASDILYFPHMVALVGEDSEWTGRNIDDINIPHDVEEVGLARILQSTFAPIEALNPGWESGAPPFGQGSGQSDPLSDFTINDDSLPLEPSLVGQRCIVLEAVKNRGDDLYGEFGDDLNFNSEFTNYDALQDETNVLRDPRQGVSTTTDNPTNEPTEQAITGVLDYSAQYECVFEESLNEACFGQCEASLTVPVQCQYVKAESYHYSCVRNEDVCAALPRGQVMPNIPEGCFPFGDGEICIEDDCRDNLLNPVQCFSGEYTFQCVDDHQVPPPLKPNGFDPLSRENHNLVYCEDVLGGFAERTCSKSYLTFNLAEVLLTDEEVYHCANDFDPDEPGGTLAEGNRLNCKDVNNECEFTALTATEVPNATPLIEELWTHLVAGNMGIFRIFYPEFSTPSAPITILKNLPGYTNLDYYAQNIGVEDAEIVCENEGTPTELCTRTYSGSPPFQIPGTEAKMFFPYLGGIYEHFLEDIQCALRPIDDFSHVYCFD